MKNNVRIAIPDLSFTATYKAALLAAANDLSISVTVDMIGEDQKGSNEPFTALSDYSADRYDGLLLPGGADVAPRQYGEENTASYVHDGLDELQISVLSDFICQRKPILGICRGHQLINVYFGGSLDQDIAVKAQHVWLSETLDNEHPVTSEPGSMLYELYGREFRTNSSHHQAVKRLGDGLIITARAHDGTIEAIEHGTLPIRAVQFHPERMCYDFRRESVVDGSLILKRFLQKAAE